MSCYIIAFQTSLTNRESLENALQAFGTWARVTPDLWAVVTEKSAVTVRDEIQSLFNPEDRIFVIRSGTEAAWRNSMAESDWLKKFL